MALVCYGTMTNNGLAAAEMLEKSGVTATVADMRCALSACLTNQRCLEPSQKRQGIVDTFVLPGI